LDFNDDEVVRTLAEVILREDFNVNVKIPKGYLVPRIPQRLNYVLIIEDLVRLNGIDEKSVIGLDIGKLNFITSIISLFLGTGPVCM
jgi:23S rRNA A1618 N6-methylase RlmF